MPGLVNTHGHSPMTLLRGVGEGLPLDRWLSEAIWPREAHLVEDDVYWGMLLACDELLHCGVTTSCELYFHNQKLIEAVVQAGLRCVVTPGILDLPKAGPEGTWQKMLERAVALRSEAEGTAGLVTVGLGPHSAYALPPEALEAVASAAADSGALVATHVAETQEEGMRIAQAHGCTAPQLLERLGVLESPVIAAHCVWLTEEDMEIFARRRVAVAHCPQSNAKLGSGIAPLTRMLAKGLRVGLGTDGPASNNDLDLWEEMRLAPMLARAVSRDATAVRADQALALATREGAAALGLETGQLAPGFLADMIHVDIDDARFVPVLDAQDLVSHLAWASTSSQVTDVWVGGRQVVAQGACLTLDSANAREQVQIRARRIADAAGR